MKPMVRTTLGKALPLQYGKAKSALAGYERHGTPVFGSSGCFGSHDKALTNGPTIIIGRKGAAGAVHYSPGPCWPTDTTYYSTGAESIHLPYFKYLLESINLGSLDRSTAIPSLSRDDYNPIQCEFPVNLADQVTACMELDLQLSRLDAAVAALKRAQANLKRYRASVLQAAVTGRLVPTEHDLAQAEGRDYETGEQLLERILTERRRTWSGKGKYREPVAPSCAICWTPDGWATGTVAQVSAIIVDCPHSTAKFISEGKPCVDTTCIEPGRIKMEKLRFVSEATYIERIARLAPQADDLIFAREGTVGTAVRIPSGLSPCLGQRVMLMRPAECINPKYFEHCLNSEVVRKQYKSQLLGSTVPHLNVADAKELVLPLPPLAEQARIVEEVERRLSVADRLEATLEANLRRATRLRQAILKKAFTPMVANHGGGQ